MKNAQEMIDAYFEGTLSQAEQDAFLQWLRSDPRNMERFAEAMHLEGALRKELNREGSDFARNAPCETKTQVNGSLRFGSAETIRPRRLRNRAPRKNQSSHFALPLGLAAGLIIVLYVIFGLREESPPQNVKKDELAQKVKKSAPLLAKAELRVVSLQGHCVAITNGERTSVGINATYPLGTRFNTEATANLCLRYLDGTDIELSADTSITISPTPEKDRRKIVQIDAGTLRADVRPQSVDAPMLVQGPYAIATVLGTSFTFSASSESNRLEVSKGRVRFTQLQDGASVTVEVGEYAVAGPGLTLEKKPTSPTPPPIQPPEAQPDDEPFSVRNFTLVYADTNTPVPGFTTLTNNAILNASDFRTHRLTIRANTSPEIVGWVYFKLLLEGKPCDVGFNSDPANAGHKEKVHPYYLEGDSTYRPGGRPFEWRPTPGNYTLTATPYSKKGIEGKALTIGFTVKQ